MGNHIRRRVKKIVESVELVGAVESYGDCLRSTMATSAAPSARNATVLAILEKEEDSSVSSTCCSWKRIWVKSWVLI